VTKERSVKKLIESTLVSDIRDALESHSTKIWPERNIEKIDKIVVHHSATKASIDNINKYHINPKNHISNTGCPRICYHFAIAGEQDEGYYEDGEILLLNNIDSVVWHCKGQNTTSVGVLVNGDFDGHNHSGGSPSWSQIQALDVLLQRLTKALKLKKTDVYWHREFNENTSCPGYNIEQFIRKFRGE